MIRSTVMNQNFSSLFSSPWFSREDFERLQREFDQKLFFDRAGPLALVYLSQFFCFYLFDRRIPFIPLFLLVVYSALFGPFFYGWVKVSDMGWNGMGTERNRKELRCQIGI